MRYLLAITLAFAFLGNAAPARAADPYDVEYTSERPLMIIRFNEHHVMYERPLYNTVARALEAKPSVMFDIVSVGPKSGDSSTQARLDQMTSANTGRVLATLKEMGVPQSRMTVTSAREAIPASEVRIFVR